MSEAKDLGEDEFVIARIAGTKFDTESRRRFYLIEWDGYDLKDNTWEEENNVYSEEAINAFHTACKLEFKNYKLSPTRRLLKNTYDPDTRIYTSRSKKVFVQKVSTESKKRSRELIEKETESVNVSKAVKEARVGIQKMAIDSKKKFDQKMEEIRQSVDVKYPIVRMPNHQMYNKSPLYHVKNLSTTVTVVNEIDDELPTDFIYIDQLKYTSPVQPPDPDFLPGCNCTHSSNCNSGCHDVISYDNNGRLIINQGTAIYECNQVCECSSRCKNRVVQKGRKLPLQIFKTAAKGWGVRSAQFIPKGTFIEEYIGEVIMMEEGDSRGAIYDEHGCSYLFDMDFAQSELPTKYVIDSFVLGNASRFFNHSCSPNLEVYAVFHDSADNQMHRLAFFAKTDIPKNAELCFDYNGRSDDSGNDDNGKKGARYACHCKAEDCRKWIYV